MQLISSQDSKIADYTDHFLGLKTIYEEVKFPYWILVHDEEVHGLIVAAREPRDLIQPAESPFVQIHFFKHEPEAVSQLIEDAKTICEEHKATFLGCSIDAEQTTTTELLEKGELTLFDESYKMVCPLESPIFPETDLNFQPAQPEDANLVLSNLLPAIEGSPDQLLQASIQNLSKLPSELLGPMLSQMDVIFTRKQNTIIGLLSFTGYTISMIGVLPNERRRGYGRIMTQWAKAYLADNGHIRAMIRVSVNNKPAIQISKTEGFRTTSHMKYYLKQYPDYWQALA